MSHRNSNDVVETSSKWKRADELIQSEPPLEGDLKLQSGTTSATTKAGTSNQPMESPKVRYEPSQAENKISITSHQTSEAAGSSVHWQSVMTASQLPPALAAIPPPPPIVPQRIPPPQPIEPVRNVPAPPPAPYVAGYYPGPLPAPSTTTPSAYGFPPGRVMNAPSPAARDSTTNSTGLASQTFVNRPFTPRRPHPSPAQPTTYRQQTPLDGSAPRYSLSDPTPYPNQPPNPVPQMPVTTSYSPPTHPGHTPYHPGTLRRRRADAYVAHDPFGRTTTNPEVAKFSTISNDTTFDDIPTAGQLQSTTSTPFQVGPGNTYGSLTPLPNFQPQLSHPTVAHQNLASNSGAINNQYVTPVTQATNSPYQYQYSSTPSPAGQKTSTQPYENQSMLQNANYSVTPASTGHPQTQPLPGPEASNSPSNPGYPQSLANPTHPQIYFPNLPEPYGTAPYGPPFAYFPPYRPPEQPHEQPDLPFVPNGQVPPVGPEETDGDSTPGYVPINEENKQETIRYGKIASRIIFTTLPKMFYLYFLLHLPSLYFARVARIFEEANLSLPEIKKMALETAVEGQCDVHAMEKNALPPQYERLKATWESFIDDVMREWQTFNIISVLLLSAILSILSQNASTNDSVLKYCALSSLICALVSLLFGCTYIIRFGSMRKTYKAAEWALEAQKTQTCIFWNVWIMLAMPVVWLTWSILVFLLCIMLFVWRAGSPLPSPPDGTLLFARLMLTFLFVLATNYGVLILATFSRYGETMDKTWKRRIDGWLEEQSAVPTFFPPPPTLEPSNFYPPPNPYPMYQQNQVPFGHPPSYPQSSPPSLSNIDVGYGYTSDQEKLDDYYTQRNTMLNKSPHLKPGDTTININHDASPSVGSSTLPSETPVLTVRVVTPEPSLDSFPPLPSPTRNPSIPNLEDPSSSEHGENRT